MMNINDLAQETRPCDQHHFKRISWTAIFIGALVGVGLSFLLNLFGIAIGLGAFSLGKDGAIVLATGGLIGIIIGVIASMLTAGYAAGYLGRHVCPQRNLGILYGFATWSIALILSAGITAQMTGYITAYSNAISHSAFVVSDNKSSATTITLKNSSSATGQSQTSLTASASSNHMACLALSVFVLFFISALASCIGACWGMSCKRED